MGNGPFLENPKNVLMTVPSISTRFGPNRVAADMRERENLVIYEDFFRIFEDF